MSQVPIEYARMGGGYDCSIDPNFATKCALISIDDEFAKDFCRILYLSCEHS